MKNSVILVGVGEMGGVFARGFLRLGHPVIPVTRDMDINAVAADHPNPELVLVSVGEKDLHNTLENLPDVWHEHLGLLQNELLPRDWQAHQLSNPTVISVWFEKKPGQDAKVLIPSPAIGPKAELLQQALGSLTIPAEVMATGEDMLFELVLKNVYIVTTNVCGLVTGGTVAELWDGHEALTREVAAEVMDIQFQLIGKELDREALIQGMLKAFDGDPAHNCMGRSAPARLQRAIELADGFGIACPQMRQIAQGL